MSFAALKSNRPNLSELVQAAGDTNQSTGGKDDTRFWKPTRDKSGNGYAVIRFLPGLDQNGTPWVRFWDHFFKGPTGQWYIEKSLTTLGQVDPVSEMNSKLWNEDGSNAAKQIVRERKRKLNHVANILVISDPQNPENEGKVFLYKFGKKIMDKIMDKMQPQFPDEVPLNPFDLWQGADFVMKIRTVEGYPNYDASLFKETSQVFNGDDTMLEKLYDQQHEMTEWSDPKNYKTYDELKARLNLVLGEAARTPQQTADLMLKDEVDVGVSTSAPTMVSAPEPDISTAESSMDDDDDIMKKFAALAND